MKIVLTEMDVARMPRDLRDGLMRFLLSLPQSNEYDVDEPSYDVEPGYLQLEELGAADGDAGPAEGTPEKVVVDITVEQARALVANLAEKSISTLRFFGGNGAVSLEELIGENSPYVNFTELKRSFVGAVNRRLRTVTGNRTAVLFKKTNRNELGGAPGIAVRPRTAMSLTALFQECEQDKPGSSVDG